MNERIRPLLDCIGMLQERGAIRVLETGCIRNKNYSEGDGHSTRFIAQKMRDNDRFISIDKNVSVCKEYLEELGLLNRVELIESDTLEYLKKFKGRINLAYLDSENSAELTMQEFNYVYPLINAGGFVVIDDATPNSKTVLKCHDVYEYLKVNELDYEIVNGQMIIWKPMHFIKIWGIERSGTVYIQNMVGKNLISSHAMSNGFGWKHGKVGDPEQWLSKHRESSPFFKDVYKRTKDNGIGSVIVIKNPYDWWGSIERYAARFTGYQPFDVEWQYKRYNDLYLSWYKELIEGNHPYYRRCIIMRYDDMLRETEKQLKRLAIIAETDVTDNIVKPEQVAMSGRWNKKREKSYLDGIYLESDKIKLVNRILSDELFQLYGFEKRKP